MQIAGCSCNPFLSISPYFVLEVSELMYRNLLQGKKAATGSGKKGGVSPRLNRIAFIYLLDDS